MFQQIFCGMKTKQKWATLYCTFIKTLPNGYKLIAEYVKKKNKKEKEKKVYAPTMLLLIRFS